MAYTLESYHGFFLYHYNPNLAAAIIFIVVFAAITAVHIWQLVRARAWFCIPFAVGGVFETLGYVARAISHNNTGSLGPYIVQSILLLVAPALFAASIYMVLGRIIRRVGGERHSLIPLRWLTKIFVVGDVLAFLLQTGGGGYQAGASDADALKTGERIILAGLFLQVIMFGLFTATAYLFQAKMRREPTPESLSGKVPWLRSLHVLYVGSALIMIRSVFRVIEYAMGSEGYLLRHEWTLYIFDALLMWLTMVVFAAHHPSAMMVPKVRDERYTELSPMPAV